MKEHGSEWISISDLMASTIAILIMVLVVMMLQEHEAEKPNEGLARIKAVLVSIYQSGNSANDHSMDISPDHLSIIFNKGTFDRGSPCLVEPLQNTIDQHRDSLEAVLNLKENDQVCIVIEGLTDTTSVPSRYPRTCDSQKYSIDNNVSLSTYRALEARKYLIRGWPKSLRDRVIISGSGVTNQKASLGEGNRRILFKVDTITLKN